MEQAQESRVHIWALAQASTVMECDHEVWKQITDAPEASLFSSVNFKLSSLVYVLGILELAMYMRMARNLQRILLSLKC